MKAIALDCTSDYLHIAVCSDTKTYASSIHVGLQHSSNSIPELDHAMTAVGITPRELDFIACPEGPGSFTGLRIGFAVAKAIQMASCCPLIAVPALDIWAEPFFFWHGLILSCIDGKKQQFYVSAYRSGEKTNSNLDVTPDKLLSLIDPEEEVLITGPDAALLQEKLQGLLPGTKIFCTSNFTEMNSATQLLKIATTLHEKDPQAGISDYTGPVYIRKSEAEEALLNAKH